MATSNQRPTRGEVARKYGHPWPWMVQDLVDEYAVERDVELRDLAKRWSCSQKRLETWVRRHGYRVEGGQAAR